MKVTYEFSLREFKAWSGGADTLRKIEKFDIEHDGAMEQAEQYIEERLGDEATVTEVNDFLWFEEEAILEAIGYTDEDTVDEDGYEEEEF